ncbi:MAG: AraC family transcriptional regulator [Saprospiraceae bacterium]|nr:AraC family transcriptional regulator [Saprospiraceae bacterium]
MKKSIPFEDIRRYEKFPFQMRPLITNFLNHEEPHRHNFEEIIWVKSGEGTQKIDDKQIQVVPNTMYLIGKGQVHHFVEGKNLEGTIITFDRAFINTASVPQMAMAIFLELSIIQRDTIVFKNVEIQEVDTLMQQIWQEYNKSDTVFGKYSVIYHLLLTLLVLIERKNIELKAKEGTLIKDHKEQVYLDFLQLLEKNYLKNHDISFYAKQLGVTARTLSTYATLYSGKTAKDIIQERLIIEAKRLLTFTDSGITQIAFQLAYEDASYFCRSFKKQTQVSPNEYRNRLIK